MNSINSVSNTFSSYDNSVLGPTKMYSEDRTNSPSTVVSLGSYTPKSELESTLIDQSNNWARMLRTLI